MRGLRLAGEEEAVGARAPGRCVVLVLAGLQVYRDAGGPAEGSRSGRGGCQVHARSVRGLQHNSITVTLNPNAHRGFVMRAECGIPGVGRRQEKWSHRTRPHIGAAASRRQADLDAKLGQLRER
jgi:hypothetical protein